MTGLLRLRRTAKFQEFVLSKIDFCTELISKCPPAKAAEHPKDALPLDEKIEL